MWLLLTNTLAYYGREKFYSAWPRTKLFFAKHMNRSIVESNSGFYHKTFLLMNGELGQCVCQCQNILPSLIFEVEARCKAAPQRKAPVLLSDKHVSLL